MPHKTFKKKLLLILLLVSAAAVLLAVSALLRTVYPKKYADLIAAESRESGVDELLLFSVVRCESSFDPDAVSSVGARGLMQLTNDTFDWVAWRLGEGKRPFDDAFDAETNVRYGAYLLSYLLDRYENEHTALAAYHAGAGAVDGWLADENYSADGHTLNKIPYRDTEYYVAQVTRTKEIYQKLYRKGQ